MNSEVEMVRFYDQIAIDYQYSLTGQPQYGKKEHQRRPGENPAKQKQFSGKNFSYVYIAKLL